MKTPFFTYLFSLLISVLLATRVPGAVIGFDLAALGPIDTPYRSTFNINRHGVVALAVGSSSNGSRYLVLIVKDRATTVVTPPSPGFEAYGISDNMNLFGVSNGRAAIYSIQNGTLTLLGATAYNVWEPTAMDSSGRVVGHGTPLPGVTGFKSSLRARSYQSGQLFDLGTLGGVSYSNNSYVYGTNDRAQSVGASDASSGYAVPALYTNGQVIRLSMLPAGRYGTAYGIGPTGTMVGQSENSRQAGSEAVMWNSSTRAVASLGPTTRAAYAVNGQDRVAGFMLDAWGRAAAFIHIRGVAYDLNQLLASRMSVNNGPGFLRLEKAISLNDRGEIVGWGIWWDGQRSGVAPFIAVVGEDSEIRLKLTAHPGSVGVQEGTQAVFSVGSESFPPAKVLWEVKESANAAWRALTDTPPYFGARQEVLKVDATLQMSGYQFRARVGNGYSPELTSNAGTLSVSPRPVAPSFTVNPVSTTVQGPAKIELSVGVAGYPTPTLQWQLQRPGSTAWETIFDGGPYSGATSTRLTITPTTTAMSGYLIRAVATNHVGATGSNVATITVTPPPYAPTFGLHPANVTVQAPAKADFVVSVGAWPPPTLRWERQRAGATTWEILSNTAPYTGVNLERFSVTSTTTAMSGDRFRVVASNPAGTTISNIATLIVTPPPTPPAFLQHPANVSVQTPGQAEFVAQVSGTAPVAYGWQRLLPGSSVWENIPNSAPYSGVASTRLLITSTTAALSGLRVRLIATNAAGQVASNVATLTVTPPPTPLVFVQHPVDVAVQAPGQAEFVVSVSGTGPASYTWQRQLPGTSAWENIPNSTPFSGIATNRLVITPTTTALSGLRIRVIAANVAGQVTSSTATLVVTPPPIPPLLVQQPANVSVQAPGQAVFTVGASGTPPFTYVWQRQLPNSSAWEGISNTGVYSGASTARLLISSTTTALSNTRFRVLVLNIAGQVTSNVVTLTVVSPPVPPSILQEPTNVSVQAPAQAVFTVGTSGTAPIWYVWQRQLPGSSSWEDLKDTAPYSGIYTNRLVIASTTTALSNTRFRVLVGNDVGRVLSNVVTLTVTAPPVLPAFLVQPANVSVQAPGPAEVNVSVSGTAPFMYLWQRQPPNSSTWENVSNVAPYSGASTNRLLIASTTTALSGTRFRVLVTNTAGQVTSNVATLTVTPETRPPAIMRHPQSQIGIVGEQTLFSAEATGVPSPSYQWQMQMPGSSTWTNIVNGSGVSGATSSTLAFTTLRGTSGALYRVVASNGAKPDAISTAATLTVWRGRYEPTRGLPSTQGWPAGPSSVLTPAPTIVNGVLDQKAVGITQYLYWQNSRIVSDFATPQGIAYEMELKIISSNYAAGGYANSWRAGYYLSLGDSYRRFAAVGITDSGVRITNDGYGYNSSSSVFVPYNTTSGFNLYRLEASTAGIRLYINGVLIVQMPVGATNGPLGAGDTYFGDGSSSAASAFQLRSLRWMDVKN